MIYGWDIPPNLSAVLIGFVPVLILLVKNNRDTAKIRRETQSSDSDSRTLAQQVEAMKRQLNAFIVVTDHRHKQTNQWLARLEDEIIIRDTDGNDDDSTT